MSVSKIPPQNIEAEKSLLGSLLLSSEVIHDVVGLVKPESFYYPPHQAIFQAMMSLFKDRMPTDTITVSEQLTKEKAYEKSGGMSYLTELAAYVPSSMHAEHYAKIVSDAHLKRQIIDVMTNVATQGYDPSIGAEDALDSAERELLSISANRSKSGFVHISDILHDTYEHLDELHKNPGALRGCPTGFPTLDKKLGGLIEGNLIILAARPSVGKTSFMLNIVRHMSVVHGLPSAFFSLEMDQRSVALRLVAAQAQIDSWKLTTGQLSEEEMTRMSHSWGVLSDAPLHIDDTSSEGVMGIRTKARRLHMEHGIKAFFVDYMQLSFSRRLENRVQEVAEISQAFKSLARELKVPVIVASQLSRAVEARGDKPQLSDLRDSGSIEQDADVVMFLHRPDKEDRDNIILSIAKHRNGPTGEIPLLFRSEQTRFYEIDKVHDEG